MLLEDDKFFLPRIQAYYDDISPQLEELGENLAIREFNSQSADIKISPEGASTKIKMIHRMNHPKYAIPLYGKLGGANLDLQGE